MKDQFNIYVLAKYYNNECSIEEKQQIENWLEENDENKKLFHSLKSIWEKSGKVPDMFHPNAELTWDNVKNRISTVKTIQNQRKKILNQLFKVAAILILLLGSAFFLKYYYINRNIFISTAIEKKEVKLPDGTMVFLNRNSSIKYPRKFNKKNRFISFEGEGFFKVTKDSKRKFIIESNNTTTTVLGTQFNLDAYNDNNIVKVTVIEGKVKFSLKEDDSKSVFLTLGEEGIYNINTGQFTEQNTKNNNFLAWKTKKYLFNETPLNEILDLLSKDYAISYKIENQSLTDLKLTAAFNELTIEEITETIEIALNLEIEVSGNELIFR